MGDRRAFVEMYEAYFGKWYASGKMGQEALWWDIVDKVPTSQFEKWFRNVLELWGMRQGSPKLRTFKIACQAVDLGVEQEKFPFCYFCNNKGLFLVPAYYDEEENKFIFNEFEAHLSIWAFPCKCKLGQARYGKYELSKENWEKAFKACKNLRIICGMEENPKLLTFEDFAKQYDPEKHKPYAAMMWQVCRDSAKIHKVKDFPEHESINFDLTNLIQKRLKERERKKNGSVGKRVSDKKSSKSNGTLSTKEVTEIYF